MASDHSLGPGTPAAHGANSECTDVLKLFFKQADTPHRGMLKHSPVCRGQFGLSKYVRKRGPADTESHKIFYTGKKNVNR